MRLLKSCLVKVSLLLLLHFLKNFAEHAALPPAIYIRIIIQSLLVFTFIDLISCVPLYLLYPHKKTWTVERNGLLVVLLVFTAGEFLIISFLNNTTAYSGFRADLSRSIFLKADFKTMASREMMVYDKALFYRLKPSANFYFNSREFSTAVNTNSAGIRDKEENLKKPGIIFLGDSYTMGWGLNNDQSYARLVAALLHTKTLNAAVPSYGTVRELGLLKKLDTTHLKYIFIQYCDNDDPENQAFLHNHNKLIISPESVFTNMVETQYWQNAYFPGKYFSFACKIVLDQWRGEKLHSVQWYNENANHEEQKEKEAANFIKVLSNIPTDLKKYQVIVFRTYPFSTGDDMFINKCKQLVKEKDINPEWIKHIVFINVSANLEPGDYYTLDTHLKPAGSFKIAKKLAETIDSLYGSSNAPPVIK